VAGLTAYIQVLLEQDNQLRQVWVTGGVSVAIDIAVILHFKTQINATISCVVWNSLLDKLAQMPIPGEQLIVLGSIRLYPQRGRYQLTVWCQLGRVAGLHWQLRNRLESEDI